MDTLTRIGFEIHDLCEQIDLLERSARTDRAAARQDLERQLEALNREQDRLLAEDPAAAEMHPVGRIPETFLTAEELAAMAAPGE
jgi:hypothetical protein